MTAARYYAGAALGLALGIALAWGGRMLHAELWPLPAEIDPNRIEAVRAYIAHAPSLSLMALPLIWGLAAALAGFVGALIGGHDWAGGAPAGLLLIAAGVALVLIPHPFWLQPLNVVAVAGLGWLGVRFGMLARPKAA